MLESRVAQAWVAKGVLKARRETSLQLMNKRFPGAAAPEVTNLINEQERLALLKEWIDAVVDASTFEDFLAGLKK